MTHPEKWYIPVTEENRAELERWRQSVATSYRSHRLRPKLGVLLSKHIKDGSYYFADTVDEFRHNPKYKEYSDYQEITLEQFRQITNSQPMKHPKKWCIQATEENFKELFAWWRNNTAKGYTCFQACFQVGHTLMSDHPSDGSNYFGANVKSCINAYPQFVEITLEQFRQITNPQPMKHPEYWPEYWCIEATEENFKELYAWWRNNAAERYTRFHNFSIGHTLMSDHPHDESKFYGGSVAQCIFEYPQFVEITLEQFREITNSNQTTMSNSNQTTMSKSIQISRDLLNAYYDAATTPQKEYLTKYFKLDGTTTVEAIRGLHDIACEGWKPKIKKNHPDCFPITKYFDFSEHTNKPGQEKRIVSEDVCKSLGLTEGNGGFIQVRNNSGNPQTHHRSFYLSPKYNWELVQDGTEGVIPVMVLIPTKK